jgi:hypothetical protein
MNNSLRTKKANFYAFLTLFILQLLDNYIREIDITFVYFYYIKNISLLVFILFYYIELMHLKRLKIEILFIYEFKCIISLAVVFSILSAYYILKNGGFQFESVEGIIRIILPIFVSLLIVNVLDRDSIHRAMQILLPISIFFYILSIGIDQFTLANIMSIQFLSSHSVFETNFFSTVSIIFCLYFGYYRENKLYLITSSIFVFFTFKRIMIIYAIMILIFGGIIKGYKEVSLLFIWITKFIIFIISYIYILLMLGKIPDIMQLYFGVEINKFTMGRKYLMERILNTGYKSSGMYSSSLYYRSMEMDIPQFYVELGILSTIALIWFFVNIAQRNSYNLFIITFCLFELLTSHWLDVTYFWIYAYVIIGVIAYENKKPVGIMKHKKRLKLKLNSISSHEQFKSRITSLQQQYFKF